MRLEDTTMPEVGPNDVLLTVMAAGVNFNGVWVCQGKPVPLSRLKTGYDFHITGSDASGVVWKVGSAVRRWKPGDEVVVHCNVSCGQCPACNGFDPLACEEQKIWGYETNWGSFAPFAKVQAQQLLPKPAHLSWEEAASYGLCLFTAYRMLVTQAHIQAGDNVLIWGAAGGLGVFAC
jgi:crotonyl-CoA carboxylase/reductase